ncbi:60S ribosomal protein L27-A, putative [Entamoeba dispar SAW760]|uniref:60S ribosomal protein L27-A, putative n=1 Tax=Entamoeba dispar (strain ATCC PRA-260 / SAW760) TaxID=370354 RepID=B0ESU7_ENTDS|nr:60S ribosomal protein L27-A, putative [Entamoeba dispar SAW760]EDR22399.1 60S ribosomal protein L27-A, putative [Entamoeba dispar SAW760]|eukprot:EDR22399.1 60S ribosomal protein L27-A, putative [Entamoeba dispar SAW760]
MSKILAPGRVVIILSGRFAGKKAVVSSVNLQGTKDRKYGFVTVVGVERAPLKITRKMSAKVQQMRTSVKSFCKVINVNHVMPTKYTVSLDQFNLIKEVKINTFEAGKVYPISQKKAISSQFAEEYRKGKESWLFTKLRF